MKCFKFLNCLLLLVLMMSLPSCKKEKVCKDVINEYTLEVNFNSPDFIILDDTKDIVSVYFDGVNEGRCASWITDSLNTCNSLCGDANIVGEFEINNDTSFYFNYYMNGCRFEQISPKIDTRYSDIKILFERLDPYPIDYNNIVVEDYTATFKIYQTIEVCREE